MTRSNNIPTFDEQLRQLIGSASVSSANPALDMSNKHVVQLLANWMDDLGFHVSIQDVDKARGKQNLIATLGPSSGETNTGGLILSGHSDTVPYDDIQWNTDPFKATEIDHGYYGLGSTDMKGFFAVAIAAIQQVDLSRLSKPLTLIATCLLYTSPSPRDS